MCTGILCASLWAWLSDWYVASELIHQQNVCRCICIGLTHGFRSLLVYDADLTIASSRLADSMHNFDLPVRLETAYYWVINSSSILYTRSNCSVELNWWYISTIETDSIISYCYHRSSNHESRFNPQLFSYIAQPKMHMQRFKLSNCPSSCHYASLWIYIEHCLYSHLWGCPVWGVVLSGASTLFYIVIGQTDNHPCSLVAWEKSDYMVVRDQGAPCIYKLWWRISSISPDTQKQSRNYLRSTNLSISITCRVNTSLCILLLFGYLAGCLQTKRKELFKFSDLTLYTFNQFGNTWFFYFYIKSRKIIGRVFENQCDLWPAKLIKSVQYLSCTCALC